MFVMFVYRTNKLLSFKCKRLFAWFLFSEEAAVYLDFHILSSRLVNLQTFLDAFTPS